jgi:two-component system chemotaxis response regulator CheY
MALRTALIAEDSASMRQLIAFALRRLPDLDVVEAADGLEALKVMATRKFDILLIDLNMPEVDGLKVIATARADGIHNDVPIIVITTESGLEDRERALALGANAYITKPIQAHQVSQAVGQLLGK